MFPSYKHWFVYDANIVRSKVNSFHPSVAFHQDDWLVYEKQHLLSQSG